MDCSTLALVSHSDLAKSSCIIMNLQFNSWFPIFVTVYWTKIKINNLSMFCSQFLRKHDLNHTFYRESCINNCHIHLQLVTKQHLANEQSKSNIFYILEHPFMFDVHGLNLGQVLGWRAEEEWVRMQNIHCRNKVRFAGNSITAIRFTKQH